VLPGAFVRDHLIALIRPLLTALAASRFIGKPRRRRFTLDFPEPVRADAGGLAGNGLPDTRVLLPLIFPPSDAIRGAEIEISRTSSPRTPRSSRLSRIRAIRAFTSGHTPVHFVKKKFTAQIEPRRSAARTVSTCCWSTSANFGTGQ
jgi:hypothetical protein